MEKVALVLVLVEMLEGVLCGAVRSQASSEGRRTLTLLGCRARRRLRHDGRVATAVLGRADAHVQPALGLVVTADAGCLSNRFCSVLLCPVHGLDPIPQRVVPSGGAAREAAAGTLGSISGFPSVAPKARIWRTFLASILRMSWHQLKACPRPRRTSRSSCTVFGFCYLLVWGYIADLSMVLPRLRRGRLASRALSVRCLYGLPVSDLQDMRFWPVASSDMVPPVR